MHRAWSTPRSDDELEDRLSTPSEGAVRALAECTGDVLVLGAGGKMGPTLTRMVRRAADTAGGERRVTAVSRFSDAEVARRLQREGIDVNRADVSDPAALARLPDAPNVFLMTGYKFGTSDEPWRTWGTNAAIPALVAARFRDSRIVAFSTGNVYALSGVARGGSREDDELAPHGEYGWSCVARERVLEYASRARGTRMSLVRLNYAVDLRYGVLVDLAQRVLAGQMIDLGMGYVNVIWQGDANSQAIQSLACAASPPFIVNVTGPDIVSIRETALELGRLMNREPRFIGREAANALLSSTQRAQELFGPPSVPTAKLIEWVAEWVGRGGHNLGKATHYEERGGRY
ncbi:MAG TPA: NAD-dependent epimerase/dehydratase family protein [Gemmatimonadaceae bacterium]|nr:NAD-dependent epimerase/dehydratase family protein [Gemmatimonadaceae bacterium]